MALAAMSVPDGGGRHHGEVSMESFIKNQMMAILQPFLDNVQEFEAKLVRCQDHLQKHDSGMANMRSALGDSAADMSDLRGAIKKTDAGLVAMREGLERVAENSDQLHLGMENMNGWVQRIQNQTEAMTREVPDLQQNLGELEAKMQEFNANLQRTSDMVSHDLQGSIDTLGEDFDTLRQRGEETKADMERCRGEAAQKAQLLQETRAVVDKSAAALAILQRSADDGTAKDADLSTQLSNLKTTMCKLQPVVEGLRKDSTFVKQRQEHHDGVLHTLQQNHGTLHAAQETMHDAHEKLARDTQVLQQGLHANQVGMDHTREGLSQANSFAAALHASMDKLRSELQRSSHMVEGLENRHTALAESVDRVVCDAAGLSREHQRGAAEAQALRHDVEKTKEVLARTNEHLEATNTRLNGVGGDLGRTSEALQRLGSSVENCEAGFSGLQKGFMETGAHIARRPVKLPQLPASPGHSQLGSGRILSRDPPSWMKDDASTQCSEPCSHRGSLFSNGWDGQPFTAR